MEPFILRDYPKLHVPIKHIERYTRRELEAIHIIAGDIQIKKDFYTWKEGINPENGKPINTINPKHRDLTKKYAYYDVYGRYMYLGEIYKTAKMSIEDYESETKKIKGKLYLEMIYHDKRNKYILKIRQQIKKLTKWSDFIVFDGKKYGLSHIVDGIHKTADCGGKVNIVNLKPWNGQHILRGKSTDYQVCEKCKMSYIGNKFVGVLSQ